MKHVLIIAPEYPSFNNVGGEASFAQNLAELLLKISKKSFEVHVLAQDDRAKNHYAKIENGIWVHFLANKTQSKVFNLIYYRLFWPLRFILQKISPFFLKTLDFNLFAFFYFKDLNRRYHFSLIHASQVHLAGFLIKKKYSTIPLLLHLASPRSILNNFEERSFLDQRIDSFLEKKYLLLADRLLACSQNVAKVSRELFDDQSLILQKLQIFPYFVQAKKYVNTLPLQKETLFFMGRLDYRKGADLLLNSFLSLQKKHPQLRLVLIGNEGAIIDQNKNWQSFSTFFYEKNLSKVVKDKISWISRIDSRQGLIDLMRCYKGIAVFPARYEPLGLTTLEAMANGMIVVAGKNGGGSEIINDGINAFLCRATSRSLTTQLQRVLALSTKKLTAVSYLAQKRVLNHYDEKMLIKKYQNLYQELKILN